jgi:3',5'-cyclic AMP phosphodiesterase CpdA
MTTKIAHISDLHIGGHFHEPLMDSIKYLNELNPDLVIVSGDLTNDAQVQEFDLVQEYLDLLEAPKFIIPGNHDARKYGIKLYRSRFGEPGQYKLDLDFTQMLFVGYDSSMPDIGDGVLSEADLKDLQDVLEKTPKTTMVCPVIHHHLVPVPSTGRQKSLLYNAGEVLDILMSFGAEMYFCGHRHVPNVISVENVIISNAGSVCKKTVRSWLPRSFNYFEIGKHEIKSYISDSAKKTNHLIGSFRVKLEKDKETGEEAYVLRRKMRKRVLDLFPIPERQHVEFPDK